MLKALRQVFYKYYETWNFTALIRTFWQFLDDFMKFWLNFIDHNQQVIMNKREF